MRALLYATALVSVSSAALAQHYGQTQPYTQYQQQYLQQPAQVAQPQAQYQSRQQQAQVQYAQPRQRSAYEEATQIYSNAPTSHQGSTYPYYYTPPAKEPPRKPWYASFSAQYVMTDDYDFKTTTQGFPARGNYTFDNGFGAGLAAGYQPSKYFRFEGEFSYRTIDLDTGHVRVFDAAGNVIAEDTIPSSAEDADDGSKEEYGFNTVNLMLNAFLDLPLPFAEQFVPYVGGGIGWTFQTNGAEENSFAYQFLTGIGWQADEQTVISLGYRYYEASGFDFGYEEDYEATTHTAEFGIRYNF